MFGQLYYGLTDTRFVGPMPISIWGSYKMQISIYGQHTHIFGNDPLNVVIIHRQDILQFTETLLSKIKLLHWNSKLHWEINDHRLSRACFSALYFQKKFFVSKQSQSTILSYVMPSVWFSDNRCFTCRQKGESVSDTRLRRHGSRDRTVPPPSEPLWLSTQRQGATRK